MAENDDIAKRPPDPFVAARISDPKAGPPPALTLVGLLGDSDRPGRRRLYLNTRLDYWVEVRAEDVLTVEDVGPDQPPFQGLDATRLTIVRDAQLDYVRTATVSGDPFAVQPLTSQARPLMQQAETWEAECAGPSWDDCPTDIGCPILCPGPGDPRVPDGHPFGEYPLRGALFFGRRGDFSEQLFTRHGRRHDRSGRGPRDGDSRRRSSRRRPIGPPLARCLPARRPHDRRPSHRRPHRRRPHRRRPFARRRASARA